MWCLVLVWPLMLAAVLRTGQSCTEEMLRNDSQRCCVLCPAGYHKMGMCDHNTTAKYRCKKCADGTFTAMKNYKDKCLVCTTCDGVEEEKKRCSPTNDTVCTCKEGYFHYGSDSTSLNCIVCSARCINRNKCGDEAVKCQCTEGFYRGKSGCQRCQMKDCGPGTACQRNCPTNTTTILKAPTTATTTLKAGSKNTTKTTQNPEVTLLQPFSHHWAIPVFLVILLTVLLLVILLLFTKTHLIRPDRVWPCFNCEKDPELPAKDPPLNEHPCHQPSNPTSLMLNIHEGTPVTLSHSPNTPEYPTHITPLLPKPEHRAPRQVERWPATVLYAIIKEVPLRRWKEFLRLLSVADQQLERVELEAGLCSLEKQYQMLRLWSQGTNAALDDIYSALHYMDLAGCAQLLQESLGKLQWKPSGSEASQHVEVAQPLVSQLQYRIAGASHMQL